ncbi:hypothetical protein MLD38_018740 [Melastoma candidum]|uniref:Uncharacterized protein n=1 Tax=Melastoma candidum TaxID=119954 RepID=A0ACB9QW29_9MYRT|nr:hypothetical protein MLD38_018740 [Melastoma candidum]
MFQRLHEMGYVTPVPPARVNSSARGYNPNAVCLYHSGGIGHDTRNCLALRFKIQSLLDDKVIAFENPTSPPNIQQNPLPEHVNMIASDDAKIELPHLFPATMSDWPLHEEVVCVLHSTQPRNSDRKPAIYTPVTTSNFVYRPSAAVQPFIYKPQVNVSTNPNTSPSRESEKETNIITRSGRVIPATEALKNPEAPKISEVPIEEAKKVVKYIRTSEYDIVEQLRKQQAQISLFDLINSSDKHRDVLQKFLTEVHVPAQIEVNCLDVFMSSLLAPDSIIFSDGDLPEPGKVHNMALFITVKCRDMMVPRVLIDGGSGVNIVPVTVLKQLHVDESEYRASNLIVRAFDGAKRKVLGEILLAISVGPATFETNFHVLDAAGSFNMLLGRPWIHAAGAVPSTVHQRVKFVVGDKLITVQGECNVPICNEIDLPYVPEPAEEPKFVMSSS